MDKGLTVDHDANNNKIRMEEVKARFPIYVKLLGAKVKIATLDIGRFYIPRFEFNGPEPVQREVAVTVQGREIKMEHHRLRVSVDLAYAPQ